MLEGDPFLVMPPIEGMEHIVSMWQRCGMATSNGFGVMPITWQEVYSFSKFNAITDEDANIIIRMSECYVKGINSKSKLPPYEREYTDEELIARSNSIIAEEENKGRK